MQISAMGNTLFPFLDLGADGNLALILILDQVITKLKRNLLSTVYGVITLVLTIPFTQRTWTFVVSYFLFIYLLYFILFMICPSESLNLLGGSLWRFSSQCDKLPLCSGRALSTIGDFPYNFSRGAVPTSKLLCKPQLASPS